MAIKDDAIIIRDETLEGANTATRVGGNLVEIADDLLLKQEELDELNSITGWESRSDIVSVVSLTASIDNVLTLTGASKSNGGLTFFDANAKITPINLNDVIQIDFACTFETPSGTSQTIDVLLKVGVFYYRGYTYNLTKGAGINDLFSVSWALPCGAQVVADGIEIVLNPSSTMNYKQRYLAVSRTHKGKI